MRRALSQLPDHVLRRELGELAARDRATTAELIAHIAEFESRRLFAPAGHPSMFSYCVQSLKMSEDVAYKRIRVGRAARRFPAILAGLADGRLHVSGVFLLERHLTAGTAPGLLAAAEHKSKSEIELLLAHRFPQPDTPPHLAPASSQAPGGPGAMEPDAHGHMLAGTAPALPAGTLVAAGEPSPVTAQDPAPGDAAGPASDPPVPGRVDEPVIPTTYPRVKPLSPQRFALQVTLDQETHDLLRRAQELLGPSVPSGDLAGVLKRALRSLVDDLERTRFAATSRPRAAMQRRTVDPRFIPAAVKRAVRARDGARCTFVAEDGKRCPERRGLEFDHVKPLARACVEVRSGAVTTQEIRLLCRTHNQYEADRIYGAGFMERKRQAVRGLSPERGPVRRAE